MTRFPRLFALLTGSLDEQRREALERLSEAQRRGCTQDQHRARRAATMATADVLRMELGR